MRLIGLDFEASGSNPWGEHVPIQIGVAMNVGLVSEWSAKYLIGGWNWREFEWSEEAEGVHGIPRGDIDAASPVWQVDINLAADLLRSGLIGTRMWNVTVGWNVAGYDRQFITRWFPNVNRLLSYRTVDLNALVFAKAVERAADTPTAIQNHYKAIKASAKSHANKALDITEADRHDALVDARSALLEFAYLTDKDRV